MKANYTGEMYKEQGVWVSKQALAQFGDFEKDYLDIRSKEQRIFSIEGIRQLPKVPAGYVHAAEWKMRVRSIRRFTRFLKNRQSSAGRIIDIGCGNGFFANILSAYAGSVYGVDVNLTELRQAASAFGGNPRLTWCCLDILDEDVFTEGDADLITFCCSFQYFADVETLIAKCMTLLAPGGAVHIIDTPFYREDDRARAQEATAQYYHDLGCDDLAQHYYHHTWSRIAGYDPVVHYQQSGGFLSSLFRKEDSPFPWIEIRKP